MRRNNRQCTNGDGLEVGKRRRIREYRTLPMVWHVPPLSPIQSAADAGELGSNGILPM